MSEIQVETGLNEMENKTAPTKQKNTKKVKKHDITVKANKKGRHIMKFMNFLRVLLIPIFWLLKPYRFFGNRKVKDGACVYVGNHYTLFDPFYPASTTWEGIHFVAKSQNFKVPILGWAIRRCKGIAANRDGNDVRAMLDCFKCLKNGEKIALYPEGTRNKTDAEMLPFHHGAAVMAIKSKAPIIPIMLYKKPRFFRMTHVLIGDPIELTVYYGRKLSEEEIVQADEKIRQHMLNMRREHKAYLESKRKGKKRS